jgi:DNA processing protein
LPESRHKRYVTAELPKRAELSAEEQLHWLALKLVPGLGLRHSKRLIDRYRTPQAIFRASRSELEAAGLAASVAQSIVSGCTFDEAAEQQQRMMNCGAELVPITAADYPPMLREIFDPPIALFARGRVELLGTLMLGVVGTRRPSTYGTVATERLAADLATAGFTIVSGMARGIDTAAHRSTLDAGGDTVAVFGCGVDTIYPAENRKLAAAIAEKGLLISEFPLGAPAYPQNFPVRNRIISGVSVGILVVEGAQYSGSSITARLALDQNREVFAVPGNITSKMSWGPNLLIKQGAKLVQEAEDVLTELSPDNRLRVASQSRNGVLLSSEDAQKDTPKFPDGPLGQTCRAVFGALKVDEPTVLDDLIEALDTCSSTEVIAALFELEMVGVVRQMPGKNFVRIWNQGN